MKKTIFLMAMLLALSAAAPMASVAQQSHRNRPHTQMVDKKDKDATDEEEGVVAYSDTVTADTASATNGGATFDNDAPVSRDELLSPVCPTLSAHASRYSSSTAIPSNASPQ